MTGRPIARRLRFKLQGDALDYGAGDERSYNVVYRGITIGFVEREWQVSAKPDGEPTPGWGFRHDDGRHGSGATRAAAVIDAYEREQ